MSKNKRAIIEKILPDSIAAELELQPGDEIMQVNGYVMEDLIDMQIVFADEYIEMLVKTAAGEEKLFEIEKDYDETLGVVMQSAVFDKIRVCKNKCVFCFVDQMPKNMRSSLYIKDDDYRLSFLSSSYVTLSNMTKSDFARIERLNISPLYVSVHTTDPELRSKMLGQPKAADINAQLEKLFALDTELHMQIVLCPGWNDGFALERTLRDLYVYRDKILSLSIVPVGMTKFRTKLPQLQPVTKEIAQMVIKQVKKWQDKAKFGNLFGNYIFLSDEFYILAGQEFPAVAEYEDYPQLENGVGISRAFIEDWKSCAMLPAKNKQTLHIDVVCGVLAESIIRPLLAELNIDNLNVRLVVVRNNFFGESITVTGLLTGEDIQTALQALPGQRDGVIIPAVTLRKGESVFLDDMTPEQLEQCLDTKIQIADGAVELKKLLYYWNIEE
ncbi:MAG: DUF512 domain-containing protein [Negativicutes bacterium]|jgi:putative radical SAM enzyme (TIGR03279 family)